MSRLLCVGLGYSAAALARLQAAEGWRITGTSTSAAGVARIEKLGFRGLHFDGSKRDAELAAAISDATHLLLSAPPGENGDPLLHTHAADIAAAPHLEWIGYLTTIGIYGDTGGGWVDETTWPEPGSERLVRRLVAELAWLDFGRIAEKRVQIFRLAGIYGPGRSAVDQMRAGTARRIVKQGQVFNRIHVDDIAQVLAAAIPGRGSRAIYNLADDEPAPADVVVSYAAELLGVAPPPAVPFDEADLTPMARSFYASTKRVRNDRIKSELGVTLRYPTYREGLAAIARDKG